MEFFRGIFGQKKATVPEATAEVTTDPDLGMVAHNMEAYLSPKVTREFFTSWPASTGGKSRYPYYRTDDALNLSRDNLHKFATHQLDLRNNPDVYGDVCKDIFLTVVWIEKGFGGLDYYLNHPVSKNSVAHGMSKQFSERYIATVRRFIEFRKARNLHDDIFSLYGKEQLLDEWEQTYPADKQI